jgi:hypothetical protein
VVSGFSRIVICSTGPRAQGRHLALQAFRQTGKTPLRFDPDVDRGGPTYSNIAPINDPHPDDSSASVAFDQTAAKSLAARRFS